MSEPINFGHAEPLRKSGLNVSKATGNDVGVVVARANELVAEPVTLPDAVPVVEALPLVLALLVGAGFAVEVGLSLAPLAGSSARFHDASLLRRSCSAGDSQFHPPFSKYGILLSTSSVCLGAAAVCGAALVTDANASTAAVTAHAQAIRGLWNRHLDLAPTPRPSPPVADPPLGP